MCAGFVDTKKTLWVYSQIEIRKDKVGYTSV